MAIIHTTDRLTWKRCRQLWEFSSPLRMNLEPNKPQTPQWFGTGIHAALAAYYEPSTPRTPEVALSAWNAWCAEQRVAYIRREGPLWVEQEQEFDANEELGREMLVHYTERFAPEHDDFEVVWVEQPFLVRIKARGRHLYGFKPDGLVRDSAGLLWILEHKTAARLATSQEWLDKDEQCGSYIAALERATGVKIEGVIYNQLRKAAPQPLKVLKNGDLSTDMRQQTPYQDAHAQIMARYGEIPEKFLALLDKLKVDAFFWRARVHRNRNEINRLWNIIDAESREMARKDQIITRTPSQMNCAFCAFQVPCTQKWEDSDWKDTLDALYTPRDVDRYANIHTRGEA